MHSRTGEYTVASDSVIRVGGKTVHADVQGAVFGEASPEALSHLFGHDRGVRANHVEVYSVLGEVVEDHPEIGVQERFTA